MKKTITFSLLVAVGLAGYGIGQIDFTQVFAAPVTVITNEDDGSQAEEVVPFIFTTTDTVQTEDVERYTKNDATDLVARTLASYNTACDPTTGSLVVAKDNAQDILDDINTEISGLPARK